MLLFVVKDSWLTGDSLFFFFFEHQISFIIRTYEPYLPNLCSPADPKAALWKKLFGH